MGSEGLRYTLMLLRAYARDRRRSSSDSFSRPLYGPVRHFQLRRLQADRLDVVDEAKPETAAFIASLSKISALRVTTGDREAQLADLNDGDRDLSWYYRRLSRRAGEAGLGGADADALPISASPDQSAVGAASCRRSSTRCRSR